MSQENLAKRLNMREWQAEILRLTAFPGQSAEIAETAWWNVLVGEPPERKISRPKKGGFQEEGPFAAGNLTLRVQPDRIDWLFTPLNGEALAAERPLTLGSFPESLDTFLQPMLHWLELQTCPQLRRLALGAVLFHPVKDRESGYRQISAYIPSVKLDPMGSSDFLYRINRPRDSVSPEPGLRINRLSTWSVITTELHQLSLGPSISRSTPGREEFSCRLELDISTVPQLEYEISREYFQHIFTELVELAKEIAQEGDIP